MPHSTVMVEKPDIICLPPGQRKKSGSSFGLLRSDDVEAMIEKLAFENCGSNPEVRQITSSSVGSWKKRR